MKVVIAQVDTLPPVLPEATSAASTDTVVLNQSGTIRTATLEQVLEALMAVDFTPMAVSLGTSYDNPLQPVGAGTPRKALAIQNASNGAGVFVFFGSEMPEDDTLSWELGPGQSWPPAGVNSVSQDGVWLRASAAATSVVILVG
jgi:hypothetical protein